MPRIACLLLAVCLAVSAQKRDAPARHLIGSQPLTAASSSPARSVAQDFLRSQAAALNLEPQDVAGAYIAREFTTAHNGVTHFIYRQQFSGMDVYNAWWTVNVDRNGRVLNAGGTLYARPLAGLTPPASGSGPPALSAAMADVRPRETSGYFATGHSSGKVTRFARAGFREEVEGQPVWYAVDGVLRPAWLFRISGENGIDHFATVVESRSRRVIAKEPLTLYQSAPSQPLPRGLVFEKHSPQPNIAPGKLPSVPPPYVPRSMQSFAGDPAASPKGWVTGIETVGNNVVAGHNPLGLRLLQTPVTTVSTTRDFSFPLELGPEAPNPALFRDASTANLFYWANRSHDLFYKLGFDEAAGNFQADNFNKGGIPGDALLAFSQYGAASERAALLNNASFTANRFGEDGALSAINIYLGGSRGAKIFTDGSFDSETVIHEYAHGVSTRLVPGLIGLQGGAMGEAWSDYFALEFTLPEGAPADGVYPFSEYQDQLFGSGIRTRPYSTRMDVNPLTFANLGRVVSSPEVHADGEIWFLALWEMRANLIQQFGDKEGRRRANLLIIDGMKLSPPTPTMVDMRDAILLADRTGFDGRSQDQIWTAFAKRGFGALAQASHSNSVHILASFEKPSAAGSLKFFEDRYVLGESVRVVLQDSNYTKPTVKIQLTGSSGDLETLSLRRTGDIYTGIIGVFRFSAVTKNNSIFDLIPGDFISAYYVDEDAGGTAKLVQATVPTQPEYVLATVPGRTPPAAGEERALFTIPPGGTLALPDRKVALPFAFPFFGKTYSAVYVSGDGLLTFDTPQSFGCNSLAALAATNGIAPLWNELAYGGAGQRNENVYMSTIPGAVLFRWAAETVANGDPVNFSTVLYEDGQILFQYGRGNQNLVNSGLFGCPTNAPTVGISPGHETYVQTSTDHHGLPALENAAPLLIQPPFGFSSIPVVEIESPVVDGRYQGVLTVRGIAYDENSWIERLDILIDGVPRRLTAPSVSRTDFCSKTPVANCPFVGFNTSFDTAALGLAPGAHTLAIRATSARGAFETFPQRPISFVVEAGQSRQPAGAIESPEEAAEVSGDVRVRGWVYAPDLRVLALDVLVDGITYGPATYGQARPDVCNGVTPRPPNCPGAGFTFILNSANGPIQLPNGKHTLQIRARDEAGRYTVIPEKGISIMVNNTGNLAPQGTLVVPKVNEKLSGVVKIYGYAHDPDGKIRTASLLVDDAVVQSLNYGEARTSECAALTGIDACPNIGFEGDFDTRLFGNGPHVMGILLVDDKGRSTIVPQSALLGMNVTIAN